MFREVHPVVERLLTVGMDLAAKQEGYGESRNSEADARARQPGNGLTVPGFCAIIQAV